jgi:hypothetical protein
MWARVMPGVMPHRIQRSRMWLACSRVRSSAGRMFTSGGGHNNGLHATALKRASHQSRAGRRVNPGVMPPLRAPEKMRAAFAPLNVARLESYSLSFAAPFPRRPFTACWSGAGGGNHALRHNKRMHATADTKDVISSRGSGRRVMCGVRRFA